MTEDPGDGNDLEELFGLDLDWRRWWSLIPEMAVIGCTAALPVLVGTGVVSRYTDWFRVPWVQDIVGVLFLWIVFLGGAVAVKYGAHVRMSALSERIIGSGRLGRIWGVVVRLSPIGMGATFLILGWRIVDIHMRRELTWLEIPLGYFSIIIPISGVLMILYTFTSWRRLSAGHAQGAP